METSGAYTGIVLCSDKIKLIENGIKISTQYFDKEEDALYAGICWGSFIENSLEKNTSAIKKIEASNLSAKQLINYLKGV